MSQDIETYEQTFRQRPAQVKLANIRGTVLVRPGPAGQVHVQAVKHLRSGNAERTTVEIEQAADGQVSAQTRFREGLLAFFSLSNPCKVDYVIEAPAGCSLKAACVSSTLTVEGVEGTFNLSVVSGALELSDLSGELNINMVSGEITGARLAGSLKLETVSGAVHCSESNLTRVALTAVSGDVTLQTALSAGPYHFSSVSGSVRLIVPEGTACSAHLSSVSGRVHTTSLPFNASRIQGGGQRVDILGGGTPVTLKSVSGSLWIGPENGQAAASEAPAAAGSFVEPPVPPMPPMPPVPPVSPAAPPGAPVMGAAPASPAPALSTTEILEQVERGEMSVEQALQALQGQP
jgi:hypothetical protein